MGKLSPIEAEALIERAHLGCVEHRFNMARLRAHKALKDAIRRAATTAKEKRRVERAQKTVASRRLAEATKANKRKQAERRRWFRNSHLTTDEIIHGPPPHLRAA